MSLMRLSGKFVYPVLHILSNVVSLLQVSSSIVSLWMFLLILFFFLSSRLLKLMHSHPMEQVVPDFRQLQRSVLHPVRHLHPLVSKSTRSCTSLVFSSQSAISSSHTSSHCCLILLLSCCPLDTHHPACSLPVLPQGGCGWDHTIIIRNVIPYLLSDCLDPLVVFLPLI